MNRAMAIWAVAVLLSALGAASPGRAQSGRDCFYARNVSSWTAVDRSTVNIRVNVNDYYQLKLLGDCPNVDWAEHIGIEHQGSSLICSSLDATLVVPQGNGLRPLRCAVTSIRRLSPDEVKALPPKQRP